MSALAPSGAGIFVWLPQHCEGGDAMAVAAKARLCGLTWVALHNFFSVEYISKLRAADLFVAYSSYSLPGAAQTAAFVDRARMARAAGADAVLVDAELEWEKVGGSVGDRSAEALDFAKRLRSAVGEDCWIGDAGAWAEPKFHPTYPDSAFGAVVDAAMPERYWTEFSASTPYAKSIEESEDEWQVTGQKYRSVVPVGCAYGTNTPVPAGHQALKPEDLRDFVLRYPTFALWSWMHMPPWGWDILRDRAALQEPFEPGEPSIDLCRYSDSTLPPPPPA